MTPPFIFTDAIWNDREQYEDIVSILQKYPEVCQVSESGFRFKVVGVLCINGLPIVIFPKNYREAFGSEDALQNARTLIRVLLRYRNETDNIDESPFIKKGENMSSGKIVSAISLLDDYCKNGFLIKQRKVLSTSGKGRYEWSKTIQKSTPFMSNGRPVYVNPFVRNTKVDNSHIVCCAHRFVIQECFREFGWLLSYDNYVSNPESLPISVQDTILILQNELHTAYKTREICVIKNIINYLNEQETNKCNKALNILATPYYQYVWEAICGYVFNNQYKNLCSILPQPVWQSDLIRNRIAQRPDVFSVLSNALLIYDAKYYDYNHTIPGWHDAVKQFFYRYTLKQIQDTPEFFKLLPEVKDIFNGFIFPGRHKAPIEYLGKVVVPNVSELGCVCALSLDQQFAMEEYAYRNSQINLLQVRISAAQAIVENS